jgi:TetR/AcrR family transcriptional repressor of lmrAB and yxaGH operons
VGTKGKETKAKIIRTASRLFKRQGYEKTSIDDICRESGVKRGNLYFHFRSKEELAQAAIADAMERQIPFIDILMEDETDPLRKVELMIDGMVGYYADRECAGG